MNTFRTFLRHPFGRLGFILVALMIALAIMAPVLSRYDPIAVNQAERLSPPSAEHWLGTDELGRDVLDRSLWGSRISLGIGLSSIALAAAVGIPIGLFVGYLGGAVDVVAVSALSAFLAFPAVLLAVVMVAVFGAGAWSAAVAVAVVNMPAFARLTRASMMAEKNKRYVEAERVAGAGFFRIVFIEILPNIADSLYLRATVAIAAAILLESALSFLGLGVPPPAPSWGSMLSEGKHVLADAPWCAVVPGVFLTTLTAGLYLLGDGLRDTLDPRRRHLYSGTEGTKA
jgi:peptide/nickel transport system permease protein